ncbi:MAG TPA: double-strand break repair protein AddB [Rhodospirillaceae bacterium]|nr:double-strand break repair protein AddB [Rhodospirillaceae bacterium]
MAICRRWGIALDNSAGQPLTQTRVGTFLRLAADACIRQFAPVAFVSLLRHDFCCVNHDYDTLRKIVDKLEILSLRGLPPEKGLYGIKKRLQEVGESSLDTLLNQLDASTHRFTSLTQAGGLHKFSDLLAAHIEMAEALASTYQERGMDRLWAGDDGTKAAAFLADLQSQAHLLPMVTAEDYEKILTRLMGAVTVRPAWGTHPSLAVLGQLEARLIDADTMILAGLNEGVWPAEPTHDPWMSRSMRKDFGLPAPERAIGLAAHDFVQAFCAPNVVLTRPRQTDGAPAVPSRWLRRLDTVLQAAGIAPQEIEDKRYLDWARALDKPQAVTPCKRPEPRPEPQHRPSQLSVTRIETWLQDPYSIYARHILRLKKLDPLETEPEARHFGDLLHKILQQFVIAFPANLPPDAGERLIAIAREEADKFNGDPTFWDYWWPRFSGVADWLVQHENVWRQNVVRIRSELPGKLQFEVDGSPFTLTARADRIDILKDGGAAIIDYKSGGTYTKTKIISGQHPQLPLEAAILMQGGFEGIGSADPGVLSYWKLGGGSPPGDDITADSGVEDAAIRALEGLQGLVAAFNNPDTPYYSLPAADNIPRYSDYSHLARVKEWTVLGDDSEEAA